jgi:hypothetical protein
VAVTKPDEKAPATTAGAASEPATKLAWVVIYPAVHVLAKNPDGTPILDDGQPVWRVIEKGHVLPADCEWQALELRAFGHVTQIQALTP